MAKTDVLIGMAMLALLSLSAAHAQDVTAWRAARAAQFAAFADAPAKAAGGGPVQLWDAPEAPPMVVVPAGEFTMGPALGSAQLRGNEPPARRVTIPRALAVARYDVTVGEFAAFVAETGHDPGHQCWTFEDEVGDIRQGRRWDNPGFKQADTHPVLCVSLADVRAYIAWLNHKTGRAYRLLTEAEYEYANRAGTTTAFWWGEDVGANHANCDGCGSLWDNRRTSPVGSFAANPFGLYDTVGDTWVWTSDCYVDPKAPSAGGLDADACEHVIKGGAWHGTWPGSRAFSRFHHTPDTHSATLGIRLAREL